MANNRELSQFANVVGYNGGNVGINRTDPNQRLNVSGNIEVNAYDNTGGGGGYNTSSGLIIGNLYDAGKSYTGSDDRTACIWQERGLDLDFATNDTLKMKITYDGKVGVGTNVPARLLHLHESNSNEALITFTTPTTGVTASDGFRVGMNGSEEALVWNNESGIIKFGTANTERLRIASDGQATFDKGAPNSANQVIARFQAESSRRLDIVWHDSGSLLGFDLPGSHSYIFKCAGSEKLRLATDGDLTLTGSDNVEIKMKCGTSSGNNILAFLNSGGTTRGNITYDSDNNFLLFNVNQSERLRITSDGRVHIGDSLGNNHSGMFQVIHEGGGNQTNDCLAFFETNANDWCIMTNSNEGGSANHYHLYFMEEGTVRGSISGSHGQNVIYGQGSDYRWKENIIDLTGTEGIDICKRLRPRKYNWIKNREGTGQINTVDGFIAHEVQEAGVLGAVIGEKDAVNEDGSIDGQMLDYGQMTPVLAAAIKGLIAKVETLEAQVTALENP